MTNNQFADTPQHKAFVVAWVYILRMTLQILSSSSRLAVLNQIPRAPLQDGVLSLVRTCADKGYAACGSGEIFAMTDRDATSLPVLFSTSLACLGPFIECPPSTVSKWQFSMCRLRHSPQNRTVHQGHFSTACRQ